MSAGVFAILHPTLNVVLVCFCVSLIADVLDGALARVLQAHSELGKILDSLADLVSFVVMPGVITYNLFHSEDFYDYGLNLCVLFYCVMGCLRLARFTIGNEESNNFIGLPTPASAMFVVGAWLGLSNLHFDSSLYICILLLLLGLLNFSRLTMLSLKSLQASKYKVGAFCLTGLVSIGTLLYQPAFSLLAGMIFYLVCSLIFHFVLKERT